jgi:hypothetical protein
MHTNEVSTCGAAPAGSFRFEEMGKTIILYLIEVIDEAHGIFGTIAFIYLTEADTGIEATCKAKAGIFTPFITCFDGTG